ncbi:MAG: site-specific integrase [Victivallaceae bacterium]|nr:site-specific integrase [Victivallaceae bacterium]
MRQIKFALWQKTDTLGKSRSNIRFFNMSVAKRKTSAGYTVEYHYAFAYAGRRYRGVCENCTTKKQAEDYERKMLDIVKKAAVQKNVRALVENFRDELTEARAITICEAYELSLQKPKKRTPSDTLVRAKRAYWNDFVAFMRANFPDVILLGNVKVNHAEAYIRHLRANGRFDKEISYSGPRLTGPRSYRLHGILSPKTVNTYQQVLAEVFALLTRDAGILTNPFNAIPKLDKEEEGRKAFTEDELLSIRDNVDSFTRPLFTIAIATALREGDICTLKWCDIDFKNEVIVKQMRKTRNAVEIPLMPPLKNYLMTLRDHSDSDSEYVLPEHAAMYLQNSSGVSYRIKQFLEKNCDIRTTRIPPKRSRAVSVKDLHSCRHTFCYYAGLYGIPLSIVQSIVGHITPDMTKHYSAHATLEAKREKMKQLPSFLMLTNTKEQSRIDRNTIIHKIETATEKQLLAIIDILA